MFQDGVVAGVTKTLIEVIKAEAKVQFPSVVPELTVSPMPPDADFADVAVSVYLYHVMESPESKNLPPVGGTGPAPTRHAPMALVLQYLVTPVSERTGDVMADADKMYEEQNLIAIVARGVRDYPIIRDTTTIPQPTGPVITPLDTSLQNRGTVLEFNVRPATTDETVNFWSSQDSSIPRPALFVEARALVLPPKQPEIAEGIVLSVGQFVIPSGPPQLLCTRNELSFFMPESAPGADPVILQPNPARVSLFDGEGAGATFGSLASELQQNNRVVVEAANLTPGTRELLLRRAGDSAADAIRVNIDQPVVEQDPVNQQWGFAAGSSELTFRVWQKIKDIEDVEHDIEPGMYGVRVAVTIPKDGGTLPTQLSNEVSFSVGPQVSSVVDNTGNQYTLTLVGDVLVPGSDISFGVAGFALEREDTGTPGPGQFFVASSPTNTIDFSLPGSPPIAAAAGKPLAIRLVVNGAMATPAWVEVP